MTDYPIYYKKSIRGAVSGRSLNARGIEFEFLLKGDPSNPKDDVEEQVIEVPSLEADKFFKRANKDAIRLGYLEPFEGDLDNYVDTTNLLSSEDIIDILNLSLVKLKEKVKSFTSPIPVQRILDAARLANKPIKTVEFLESKIETIKKP